MLYSDVFTSRNQVTSDISGENVNEIKKNMLERI